MSITHIRMLLTEILKILGKEGRMNAKSEEYYRNLSKYYRKKK